MRRHPTIVHRGDRTDAIGEIVQHQIARIRRHHEHRVQPDAGRDRGGQPQRLLRRARGQQLRPLLQRVVFAVAGPKGGPAVDQESLRPRPEILRAIEPCIGHRRHQTIDLAVHLLKPAPFGGGHRQSQPPRLARDRRARRQILDPLRQQRGIVRLRPRRHPCALGPDRARHRSRVPPDRSRFAQPGIARAQRQEARWRRRGDLGLQHQSRGARTAAGASRRKHSESGDDGRTQRQAEHKRSPEEHARTSPVSFEGSKIHMMNSRALCLLPLWS